MYKSYPWHQDQEEIVVSNNKMILDTNNNKYSCINEKRVSILKEPLQQKANKKDKHHNYTIMQPFDHYVEYMAYIYHATKSRDSILHDV